MTVSVLGPGGYPRPPYGSFSGKPSSGTRGRVSVLGPGGYPKAPYATFAGKTPAASGRIQNLPFFATMGQLTGY